MITFSYRRNIASDLKAYDFLIIKRYIYIHIYMIYIYDIYMIYMIYIYIYIYMIYICFSLDRKMVQGVKNGRNDRDLQTNNDESCVEVVLVVVT